MQNYKIAKCCYYYLKYTSKVIKYFTTFPVMSSFSASYLDRRLLNQSRLPSKKKKNKTLFHQQLQLLRLCTHIYHPLNEQTTKPLSHTFSHMPRNFKFFFSLLVVNIFLFFYLIFIYFYSCILPNYVNKII